MSDGNWPFLNEHRAFEAVLSDIPLFCVGLMAMGFITFIFALKRANTTAIYLCSASLLLFIAAILDLGQLLIREPEGSIGNLDERVVTGFMVVREAGLGLSYGFLFLFVWRVAAECPYDERSELLARPIESSASQLHSASWTRWGLLGAVLKWFTLTLVIVIPLLQILWRLIGAQRQYGSIYIASSTLEIVASAIFVLKIILNVLVSPSTSWWIPFRYYLGLVLGLIITGTVGVGNLIFFVFSETVLGRFLHAIGMYILLLWNLITIFRRRRISQPLDDQEASSIPQESKGQATNMSPQPRRRTPSIVAVARLVTPTESGPRPLHISTTSRLSMVVNRVEQSETLAEITRTISSRSSRLKSPVTKPSRPRKPELQFDIITPTLPSTAEDLNEEPPTTGISLGYYMMNTGIPDAPIIREPLVNPSKPSIYQVDKQEKVGRTSPASLVAQPPSQSASLSSIYEFVRQQNESIAQIKLLSQDSVHLSPFDSTLVPAPESPSLVDDSTASAKSRPQSTLVTESLSPHSEFSLSAFPIPPSLGPEGVRASRFTNPAIRKLPQPPDQVSNRVVPVLSVSESPFQMSGVAKMSSGGTQYDVTSFIGNLTETENPVNVPSMNKAPTRELKRTADDDRDQAEQELPLSSSVASDSSTLSHLKPMLLPTVANGRKAIVFNSLRPIHAASRPSQSGWRDSNTTLKPFLLGTPATSVPPSLPSSTMVPLGSRRGSRAARIPTHKSRIGAPRMSFSDALDEEVLETYERPRSPPIFTGLSDRPKA